MAEARDKLVIGIDSSTQSTKAVAWNRSGGIVAMGSAPIPTANPRPDYFVQRPTDWWQSCCSALRLCLEQIEKSRIEAMAIAHQRETVAFLDEKAESLYPAIVWLDERSRSNVVSLSESIGIGLIHRITGRYPDLTPTIYKFDWMRQNEPEIFSRTACFADVQCYLVRCLAGGPFRTGWLSADSFGIYDIVERQWSPMLLDATGIPEDRLPSTVPPGGLLGNVTRQAASETGLPDGLPIFAAGGDGAYAGLGTESDEDAVAISRS